MMVETVKTERTFRTELHRAHLLEQGEAPFIHIEGGRDKGSKWYGSVEALGDLYMMVKHLLWTTSKEALSAARQPTLNAAELDMLGTPPGKSIEPPVAKEGEVIVKVSQENYDALVEWSNRMIAMTDPNDPMCKVNSAGLPTIAVEARQLAGMVNRMLAGHGVEAEGL